MPALNYQSRLRPQTMMLQPQTQLSPNPGTVGTQMTNPGSPISITWKFAPAGGGMTPTKTKLSPSAITQPESTQPVASRIKLMARPIEFWEEEPYTTRLRPQEIKQPTEERPGYESVVRPPGAGELYGKAIAPVYQKYLEASEEAAAALSKRRMGRSGALLGHPELGKQALFGEFTREAGAIASEMAIEEEKARQEWARLGLNERQIEEMARQFDEELEWQKEEFGLSFTWEQQKWLDDLAYRYKELAQSGDISYQQMQNDMNKFYETIKQNAWIAQANIALQNRQLDLDTMYRQGQLTIEQYNAETARLRDENDALIRWAQFELDRTMAEFQNMRIFGYYDEDGNYHRGELDLKEWETWLSYLLGLRGTSNEEPTGEEPTTPTGEEPTYPEIPAGLYGWWPGERWSWDDFIRQYPGYANDPEDIEKIKAILQANPNITWEAFIIALARSYGPNIPWGPSLPGGGGGGGNRLFGWQPGGGGR